MLENLFGAKERSSLIDAASRDLGEMLEQADRMLGHSLAALLDHQPLAVDLERMDDVVDGGERMVRRTVLEHLSINPRHDLVTSLLLASTVEDAERVGDCARGVGQVVALARHERRDPFADRLRGLADRLRPLLGECRSAFVEDDRERAEALESTYETLKADYLTFTRDLAGSDLSADLVVVYTTAAHLLRRIGAHLSNIASSLTQPYDKIRHSDED